MKISKILQWNCRSLTSRYEEIKTLIKDENPDCICLQEIKLRKTVKLSNRYTVHALTTIGQDIPKGGVMIALKTNVEHRRIHLHTTLQAVTVETPTSNIKSITSIYLPPRQHISKTEVLDLIEQLPKPMMLLGDFNAHHNLWYSDHNDTRGKDIEKLLTENDLLCLNTQKPTYYRVHDQVTSILDLSIVSSEKYLDYTWDTLPELHGSDHYPIIIKTPNRNTKDGISRWNFDKANWSKYREQSEIKKGIQTFHTVESAYKHLIDKIKEAANLSIPKKKTKLNKPPVPWWNEDCNREKKNTRTAFRRMRNNPTTAHIITYKRRNSIKQRTYKNARRISWKQYVSTLTNKTPTRKVWEKIKKIEGKYNPKPLPILIDNGTQVESPTDVANLFANYYSEISSQNQATKTKTKCKKRKVEPDEEYNNPFDMSELTDVIHLLKDNKSPGEDFIENIMIKKLPQKTIQFMLNLFNKIWTTKEIPPQWKTSIIIPILKHGKQSTIISNYRPIALNSCICKVMERMVNTRLTWYLERNERLSTQQFGFRKNRSTIEPIAQLTTQILNGFMNKQITIAISFDIQKAFDTLNQDLVIDNLYTMGITGNMLKFIENYIKNRSIKVRIGNEYSAPKNTKAGTPQGGVLSATCFIVAINNILKSLPQNVKGSLYADDLVIYCTTSTPDVAE